MTVSVMTHLEQQADGGEDPLVGVDAVERTDLWQRISDDCMSDDPHPELARHNMTVLVMTVSVMAVQLVMTVLVLTVLVMTVLVMTVLVMPHTVDSLVLSVAKNT
jgi:hypothetical protein